MLSASKKGFTVAAPVVRPPLSILDYKSTDDPEGGDFRLAVKSGQMMLIQFVRSANINRSGPIMRFLERRFFKSGFSSDMIDRLSLAMGEIIPNAFQHALPESRVGITIVVFGQAPHRHLTMMVSNYLDGNREPPPPSEDQVKEFEAMLFETRGRGIAIVREIATDVSLAWSEGFEVITVAHFKEA